MKTEVFYPAKGQNAASAALARMMKDFDTGKSYADMMRYDNLLLDKGTAYNESSVVIAIRHYDLNNGAILEDFVKRDQLFMKQSVKPAYKKAGNLAGLTKNLLNIKASSFHTK